MPKTRNSKKPRPVITISGPHGTGKTTYAKAIAEEFKLRHVSAGILFREAASERGLSLLDFTYKAEEDESVDRYIDEAVRREAEKGGVVLDGQLSAWIAGEKASLKIYSTAPLEVRVKRIAERDGISLQEAEKITVEREEREKARYFKIYKIGVNDLSIYDMIVDTTLLPLKEMIITFKNILREIIKN